MIPTEIDRRAPVIVRLERRLAAPLDRVWRLHTAIADWPRWQHDVTSAALEKAVAPGGSFTWTTAGLDEPIVSTIYALTPHAETLWGGPSAGIVGVHHWTFAAIGGGTRVVTEESWAGPPVDADPDRAKAMLTASLNRWLGFLDTEAMRADGSID